MKLIRLSLENFRQHRSSTIEFRNGMTAIVGPNGSGKTTILEAITYALYGIQRKTGTGQRTKRDDLKFHWATEQKAKLRVVLDFEFDGRLYTLERTEKDASLSDMTEGLAVVKATGLSECKSACERLLHLTYDHFKNSFCAEQKSLAFLHFNTDTRRQEQVAKMLGFDRLRVAAELSRSRSRERQMLAAGLEANLGDLKALETEIGLAIEQSKGSQDKIKAAEIVIASCDVDLVAALERKVSAEQYQLWTQAIDVLIEGEKHLRAKRDAAELVLEDCGKRVARFDLLTAQAESYSIAEKEIASAAKLREIELERRRDEVEKERLLKQVAELKVKASEMPSRDLKEIHAGVESAVVAHEKAEQTRRELESEWIKAKATLEAEVREARNHTARLTKEFGHAEELAAKGICPECGQVTGKSFGEKLDRLRQGVVEAAGATEQLAKRLEATLTMPTALTDAGKAVADAKAKHSEAQTQLQKALEVASEIKAIDARGEEIALRLDEIAKAQLNRPSGYDEKAHEALIAQLETLKPVYEEHFKLKGCKEETVSALAVLNAAKLEFGKAHDTYLELRTKRSQLPFEKPDDAVAAISQYQELTHRRQIAEVELREAKLADANAQRRLTQAEARLSDHMKNHARLTEERRQAALLDMAGKEMANLREELNGKIRPELADRASDNLALLTNGRYPRLELDDDFNATVLDEEIRKQVISGGEEDVVALALRLALSELIQERQGRPMSLLILDEVFGSLDADRRQAVLERLMAIKGRFNQILVISHIEEINQVADQCLYLARDDATKSTVVSMDSATADSMLANLI